MLFNLIPELFIFYKTFLFMCLFINYLLYHMIILIPLYKYSLLLLSLSNILIIRKIFLFIFSSFYDLASVLYTILQISLYLFSLLFIFILLSFVLSIIIYIFTSCFLIILINGTILLVLQFILKTR